MLGGQGTYESVMPDDAKIAEVQETLMAMRNEKQVVRETNRALTEEISELVQRIVGVQRDLQQSLKELASFGEDSPYMPSQTSSHFAHAQTLQTEQAIAPEERHLQLTLERVEARIAEIEEFVAAACTISGFSIVSVHNQSVKLRLEIEKLVAQHLSPAALPEFFNALLGGPESQAPLELALEWSVSCQLTRVVVSRQEELFEDVISEGFSTNSPSFILREVPHRMICLAKRFDDFFQLVQADKVQLMSTSVFESPATFSLLRASDIVVRLFVPTEYPSHAVRIQSITRLDGSTVEACSTIDKKIKFTSLTAVFDEILRALSL